MMILHLFQMVSCPYLVRRKVWADNVPPSVVTEVPVLLPQKVEVKEKVKSEPDIDLFPACAARAMSRE